VDGGPRGHHAGRAHVRYLRQDWNATVTSPVVPPRLAVGVVGTGRVGAVLGAALESVGHRVVAASAVSGASRARAAALLPTTRLVAAHLVPADADLVLLTVPDDALADLVAGLATTGSLRPGQLVAHTSGRHGLAVLEPVRRAGAVPLALHPVLPFSGTGADLHRLVGAAWGVTCSDAALPVAQALVLELGGLLERVPEERRPRAGGRPSWRPAPSGGSPRAPGPRARAAGAPPAPARAGRRAARRPSR
jgi:predicted short-subunit dehydrogenase-like oxidoreductase (DUF2520 family)